MDADGICVRAEVTNIEVTVREEEVKIQLCVSAPRDYGKPAKELKAYVRAARLLQPGERDQIVKSESDAVSDASDDLRRFERLHMC